MLCLYVMFICYVYMLFYVYMLCLYVMFICYVYMLCLYVMFICYVYMLCLYVMFICYVYMLCLYVMFICYVYMLCLYVMKEGSQNLLKHRVPAGEHIINGNNIRYSLSFRRFLGNKTTHVGQSDRVSSSTALTSSNSCRPRAVIFAGDSHFAKLDPHRLHKDKFKVLDISKGGSKLRDVEKALSDFYVNHSHEFHIEKIFLSIGTNDIRYCQDGAGFLTKPLAQLFTKTEELFPNSNIIVQNLLPLPITNRYVANNVLDFKPHAFQNMH